MSDVASQSDIVIAGAARTPLGAFQGNLAHMTSPQLGGFAIQAALNDARCDTPAVQELIMGCVLPAGVGQAPARQAAIRCGGGFRALAPFAIAEIPFAAPRHPRYGQ